VEPETAEGFCLSSKPGRFNMFRGVKDKSPNQKTKDDASAISCVLSDSQSEIGDGDNKRLTSTHVSSTSPRIALLGGPTQPLVPASLEQPSRPSHDLAMMTYQASLVQWQFEE
jgi:hypothetical protein